MAALAIVALAFVFGGVRGVAPAVICLAGIRFLGLWHNAMLTLTMVLVATILVMVLALVFGVWMARSRAVDLVLRPMLDAGQTIPPFVYLIPVLALFGPTRFTAIVAGVVYAAPVAIKLVADGVKGVSPSTVEASRSTGATTWQEITKVQLPMARARCCSRPTRVCSTCSRWSSSAAWSAPRRSGTTSCSAPPARRTGARAPPPASPSCCSASCSTASCGPRPTQVPTEPDQAHVVAQPAGMRTHGARYRRSHTQRDKEMECGHADRMEAGARGWLRPRRARRSCSRLRRDSGGSIDDQTKENESQGAEAGDCGEVNMAVNPWVGYEADAYVVATSWRPSSAARSTTRS